MAYNPITSGEIAPGQPVIGDDGGGFGRKVKDNFDHLYGAIGVQQAGGQILNPSFEIDSDADGKPDNWTISLYQNGSQGLETGSPAHGAAALKFTRTAGSGNGGGYADSDYIEIAQVISYVLALIHWATAAGMKNQVYVRFFDKGKIYLSEYALYSNATDNPTSATLLYLLFTPPVNARYIKFRLIGGFTDTDVAGTAYFDGLRLIPLAHAMPPIIAWDVTERTGTTESFTDAGTQFTINAPLGCTLYIATDLKNATGVGIAYARWRIGSTYSSLASSTATTYPDKPSILTLTTTKAGPQLLALQLQKAVGGGNALGRKANEFIGVV